MSVTQPAPRTATTRFWHPFADMGAVSRQELLIERGEGVWVFDDRGRRYLDATASLWYANIGHAREEVADAVSAQMRTLEAYSTFGDFSNRPANELTERLAPGDVLLLHDADDYSRPGSWQRTVKALPAVLDEIARRGLTTATP